MLRVKATGQVLRRLDTLGVVSDSINYLYAHFDLPSEYTGTITAHFKVDVNGVESGAPITLDAQHNCLVPSNVIRTPGFSIAVSSSDNGIYIVTDALTIDVASCGVPSELLPAPGEITNQYAELATAVSTCTTKADECVISASNALTSENNAKASETTATTTANAIVTDEQTRQENEVTRQDYYNAYKECNPYNSTTSYVVGNKATYNGSTYQCKVNCVGVLPTNTTNWILIAQRGADGIGAGDMLASVYDTAGIEADIFDYADTKIAKSDIIQNDTTNDSTKVPSSAVTYQHGLEIDVNTSAIATIISKKPSQVITTYFSEGETILQFALSCTTNSYKMRAGASPSPSDEPVAGLEYVVEVFVGDLSRRIVYLHVFDSSALTCIYKIDIINSSYFGGWKKNTWEFLT